MTINSEVRAAVEAQLQRMVETPVFRRKPRVRSFLEYTVRQTLDEQHTKLKEYSIAVEVFRRPEDFDPRLDSIVRVEARRLRATVDRYYETDGNNDEILIRYRRGNYVPSFERKVRGAAESPNGSVEGILAAGNLLLGVLGASSHIPGAYQAFAGAVATASVTILRPPLTPETVAYLRSGHAKLVLLKPATVEEVKDFLQKSAHA